MLESSDAATERHGDFVVAGVAQRGSDVDEREIWTALDAYADALADVAIGDARYGVLFDFDEGSEEFTYVAGVEVESTDGLDPELTVVEIPDATYAVFQPTAETVDDVVAEIEEEEFADGDDDYVQGPLFVRYDADENPAAPHAPVEFYVPVAED